MAEITREQFDRISDEIARRVGADAAITRDVLVAAQLRELIDAAMTCYGTGRINDHLTFDQKREQRAMLFRPLKALGFFQ